MAATTYTVQATLTTTAQRNRATEILIAALQHGLGLGIWMRALSVNVADGTITATFTDPFPAGQLAHLGIVAT